LEEGSKKQKTYASRILNEEAKKCWMTVHNTTHWLSRCEKSRTQRWIYRTIASMMRLTRWANVCNTIASREFSRSKGSRQVYQKKQVKLS
jgi:hypothetical protein